MKKAISIQTTLAWVIYAVFVIALISLSSCGSTKHRPSYQDHLRTTHNRNFVVVDNGGCGWNR